jgi:hypothetical protein
MSSNNQDQFIPPSCWGKAKSAGLPWAHVDCFGKCDSKTKEFEVQTVVVEQDTIANKYGMFQLPVWPVFNPILCDMWKPIFLTTLN